MQGPAVDIAQLAFDPPLQANATRAVQLTDKTLTSERIDAIPVGPMDMMPAPIGSAETVAAAWFAGAGERSALWRLSASFPLCKEPAIHVLGIAPSEIIAKQHL
jgi:hypothetical protein